MTEGEQGDWNSKRGVPTLNQNWNLNLGLYVVPHILSFQSKHGGLLYITESIRRINQGSYYDKVAQTCCEHQIEVKPQYLFFRSWWKSSYSIFLVIEALDRRNKTGFQRLLGLTVGRTERTFAPSMKMLEPSKASAYRRCILPLDWCKLVEAGPLQCLPNR